MTVTPVNQTSFEPDERFMEGEAGFEEDSEALMRTKVLQNLAKRRLIDDILAKKRLEKQLRELDDYDFDFDDNQTS